MKIKIFIIFIGLLIFHTAFSQNIPQDLSARLIGKTKLAEIMQVVNLYYNYGRSENIDSTWNTSK